MNRNAWRTIRTVIRLVFYFFCVLVVLYPIMVCVPFLMNPFAGFAGSSEFVDRPGLSAKRSMDEWPVSIDPANVRIVSRKCDFSIDSHSAWYKIELNATSAQIWEDYVHSKQELYSRESIQRDDRGLEGVRRVLLGPPPLHQLTGYVPDWWKPTTIDFRATEAMKWYSGIDSGVGQATYTGYDAEKQTLWVYTYAGQHDRLWEPNQIPDGEVFSRLKESEQSAAPTKSRIGP